MFVANAAPILAKNISFLKKFNTPVSEKYLWKNKTYRGFLAGIISGWLVGILIFFFQENIFYNQNLLEKYQSIVWSADFALFLWMFMWFAALLWDSIKSFVKRKVGIAPGQAWPVFDGIDYIVGTLVFCSIFFIPDFWSIVFLLVISPVLSLISNTFSYLVGWKDVWY
jgi:CDP-2,3-bis-(O-geranylgeranyl)-sn-glycerol synthase